MTIPKVKVVLLKSFLDRPSRLTISMACSGGHFTPTSGLYTHIPWFKLRAGGPTFVRLFFWFGPLKPRHAEFM
jgi:hypothetical protein